jgi:hypothetical protein
MSVDEFAASAPQEFRHHVRREYARSEQRLEVVYRLVIIILGKVPFNKGLGK